VFSLFGNTLKSIIGPLYASEIVGADSDFKSGTLCLFSWSASSEHVYFDDLFVTKYLDPEPGHGGWGSETASNFVTIDQTFMSAARTDVGSPQTVGFHAKWANNGSDVIAGTVYVNGTEYTTNDTGWLSFTANSPVPESRKWLVTGVNCGGVTTYTQTAPSPSIIWDQIRISDGGVTKESVTVGETTIVWFKAYYEYDGQVFNGTEGTLYVDGSEATWSTANNRWEYSFKATTAGSTSFLISGITDNLYSLTALDDTVGPQTVKVWSSPFSIISNSTITELVFDSTNKTLGFTVSGPSGTTGCTNITISRTIVTDINELTVYLDGNQINYTAVSTEYTWLLNFTYHHSTHKVLITLGSSQVESFADKVIVICTAIMAILLTTLLITKRRKQR
jgi:hypothetical protein